VPTLWGLNPIHLSVNDLREVAWLQKEIKGSIFTAHGTSDAGRINSFMLRLPSYRDSGIVPFSKLNLYQQKFSAVQRR
jgi:hypothetical protein